MTFTGTLIKDLMAAVERAEQRAQSDGAVVADPVLAGSLLIEPWLASVQQNLEYDSKSIGVA